MLHISPEEIAETLVMVQQQHLDIRTVTLGVSIGECAADTAAEMSRRLYDRVTSAAERLVPVCETIEREYGIPIRNKRISVSPVAEVAGRRACEDLTPVAGAMDRAAATVGVDFIGGFSALVHKGVGRADDALIRSIPQALASTQRVCASVNVASTRAGINMDAIARMAHTVKETAALTADADSIGCAKLVVFANMVEDNPFMAGAVHGSGEADVVVNVGISGPGVVRAVVAAMPEDADLTAVAEAIKATSFKITRAGELVAREAARRLGVSMGIVDLSLAPTPAEGDSVADILEAIGVERCGAPGTTTALALLNDAVKKGGAMGTSSVGGLSGAFIPVSEDAGMVRAVEAGALTLEKLEAMTAVCSVGLDMIAVPGDTPAETLAGIISDACAIGVINNKTTAARLIPAMGKKAGDRVSWGGLLGAAPVMDVSKWSSAKLIARGGRMPAPLGSLRN
ncbi:MAG: PFL family protein [Actinobacteria bacterium]|nr:PFL family protein [Actinomycetota bacterium]